jgi:hypothetical protein
MICLPYAEGMRDSGRWCRLAGWGSWINGLLTNPVIWSWRCPVGKPCAMFRFNFIDLYEQRLRISNGLLIMVHGTSRSLEAKPNYVTIAWQHPIIP